MKFISVMFLLSLGILAVGCSSISINHDWDRDAPFPTYKTYSWLEIVPDETPGIDVKTARQTSDLLIQRIKRSVNTQMAAKGLSPANGQDPDLLVMYHTGVEQKVNVTDWGYNYSYGYWGYGGRQIDVYEYHEGTLIIDLIDAKAKELVWRGSAQKAVDQNMSAQKADAIIDEAVTKIFTKYPPPN